jgi:hypothetical protein
MPRGPKGEKRPAHERRGQQGDAAQDPGNRFNSRAAVVRVSTKAGTALQPTAVRSAERPGRF